MLRTLRMNSLLGRGCRVADSEAVERAVHALKAVCGQENEPGDEQLDTSSNDPYMNPRSVNAITDSLRRH